MHRESGQVKHGVRVAQKPGRGHSQGTVAQLARALKFAPKIGMTGIVHVGRFRRIPARRPGEATHTVGVDAVQRMRVRIIRGVMCA